MFCLNAILGRICKISMNYASFFFIFIDVMS